MSSAYRVAPIFLIRMAGVPFDTIERLATSETAAITRELVAANISAPDSRFAPPFERELNDARSHLLKSARIILPRTLLFGMGGVRELLATLQKTSGETPPPRNARAGDRERHLLLYLQRVCTKNDTFSEFGPSGWGRIDPNVVGLRLNPEPGMAKRDAFLERWTAHAIAAAINAENSKFTLQVPALESHAFDILLDDVRKWPPSDNREKWLSILEPLAELPKKFSSATEADDRRDILDDARARLQTVGAEREAGDRSLYAATNPIGEECFRECHFEIGESLINEVPIKAEPWIDLWRDTYAFVASRVAETLRQVLEKTGATSEALPLPKFLQACAAAKLPLTGPGLIAPAVMAFQEVKAVFRQRLQPHADLSDYELTTEDCHVVRNSFDYPKFDDYTYPSADLQLAASSVDEVGRGNYRWILAELHPPPALLHHCMYWACPDKTTLNHALASTINGRPNFHFGFFAADFTAHTAVRIFDALPQFSNFVAPQRPNPHWRVTSPNDAEVYVDSTSRDVCVRRIDNHEHLGSFARAWIIPLGFHPFQFSLAPHTPRLRCGRVIVQRQSWTLTLEEFPKGKYTGVSRDLVFAVEQLRSQKGWPRHIYIRPTEQALRRSGAEGRDKDTKPIYIDLESYLFLEIFYRWLNKAGELEITEMLPAPDDLLWREPDGRRTFELRTLIVPKK